LTPNACQIFRENDHLTKKFSGIKSKAINKITIILHDNIESVVCKKCVI
jgi:RNase P subunit RPR2